MEKMDNAFKGVLTRDNIAQTMPKIAIEAIRLFGITGNIVAQPQSVYVWGNPERKKEAETNAAKAVGWFATCLDDISFAAMSNEGKLYPSNNQTPLEHLKALVEAVTANGSQATQASQAMQAAADLRRIVLMEAEDIEIFFAKWAAALKRLREFGNDLISERAAVYTLLEALKSDTHLFTRVMDYGMVKEYVSVSEVIECAKRMRQVTKAQINRNEVGLLSSADLAAPAIEKGKANKIKSDKAKCEYCFAVAKKTFHNHSMFKANGDPECHRMIRDRFDPAITAKFDKAKPSSVTVNKEEAYLTLSPNSNAALTAVNNISKDTVVADTGASAHIFNNRAWFTKLWRVTNKKMTGLGGTKSIEHEGTTPFGKAYLCENLAASLFSVNQSHRDKKSGQDIDVTYNEEHNYFDVKSSGRAIRFATSTFLNVPHVRMKPADNIEHINLIETTENAFIAALDPVLKTDATLKEIAVAREVRRLHRALNHPPDFTLTRTLKMGGIANANVTYRDVKICAEVLGPCPVCIAARDKKDTRGGQYEPAEFPGEHLRCDVVHFRGAQGTKKPHILAVDERTGAIFVERVAPSGRNYNSAAVSEALSKVIEYFKARSMPVQRVYFDADPVVAAIGPALANQGIRLTQWPPGQHEPVAENATNTLSNDMRAALTDLPYNLPEKLTSHLAADCAMTRRLMSNTHCGTDTPYMYLEGTNPYSHVYDIPFGSLVMVEQVKNDPSRHLDPRKSYAVVVERHPDVDRKCSVYMLKTGEVTIRSVITSDLVPKPYPKEIISLLNEAPITFVNDQLVGDKALHINFTDNTPGYSVHDNVLYRNEAVSTAASQHRKTAHNHKVSETRTTDTPSQNIVQTDITSSDRTERNAQVSQPNPHTAYRTMPGGKRAKPDTEYDEYARTYKTGPARRAQNTESIATEHTSEPSEQSASATVHNTDTSEQPNTKKTVSFEEMDVATAALDKLDIVETEPELDTPSETESDEHPHTAADMIAAYLTALHYEGVREYTLNELLRLGSEGEAALVKEVQNIVQSGAWKPVKANTLSDAQRKEAITSFVFGKRKLNHSVKARLVANGKQLPRRQEYQQLFSPTSNPMTTMVHLAVASYERRPIIFTADFPAAYLKVERKKYNMPIEHTRITGTLLNVVLKAAPDYKKYVTPQGALYLQIMQSIYGLTESAALWFRELRDLLLDEGFVQCIEADPCLFTHPVYGTIINIHVDDCLISCKTLEHVNTLHTFFTKHKCTIHVDEFLFLGMNILRTDKGILVSMQSLLTDKMKQWKIKGDEAFPHKTSLMNTDDSEPLGENDKATYVSRCMALLYCGLRTRFDILFTLSVLSQRCSNPTQKNMEDLNHLLRYVNGTQHAQMLLDPSSMESHVYADSSFMSHADRKGHTGVMVTMGEMGPVISAKSTKQKMQASSSTDGEIISAFESVPQLRLVSSLLTVFGYPSVPILHQDNISAIHMMENGRGTSKQTKHFQMRLNVLHELIKADELRTQHTPDTQMPADLLTKPITGHKFTTFMNTLMGMPIDHS